MELKRLQMEVSDFCRAHGDPAVIAKYSRYFREGYDAYGVPDAPMREFRAKFFEKYAERLSMAEWLALGRLLMSSGKYEEALTAILLLQRSIDQLGAERITELEYWLDNYVTNWAVCDVLCGRLLSPLLRQGTLKPERLRGWADSESRWRRRALPVSLIQSIPAGRDIPAYVKLAAPLMHDSERVVQQGLGWFLRDCWKQQPKPVEALLLKHKDTAPRLIYQYACEKMDQAAKERFKRSKQAPKQAKT